LATPQSRWKPHRIAARSVPINPLVRSINLLICADLPHQAAHRLQIRLGNKSHPAAIYCP